MARLFFALWPDAAVRSTLARWAGEAQALAGGRITRPSNLHMTLAFLGETDTARLAQLQAAAAGVRLDPCVMHLDRVAWWRHNRIVWAGGNAPVQLLDAVSRLRQALLDAGLHFDAKPFVPHVTLLRKARAFSALPQQQAVRWRIDRFVLVASERDSEGPAYRIVAGPFGLPG